MLPNHAWQCSNTPFWRIPPSHRQTTLGRRIGLCLKGRKELPGPTANVLCRLLLTKQLIEQARTYATSWKYLATAIIRLLKPTWEVRDCHKGQLCMSKFIPTQRLIAPMRSAHSSLSGRTKERSQSIFDSLWVNSNFLKPAVILPNWGDYNEKTGVITELATSLKNDTANWQTRKNVNLILL